MSSVDDTIWQHLVDHHGAEDVLLLQTPPRSPRHAAIAAVATAGVAVIVAGTVLALSPATQPAYALTENGDGSVTVTIHDLASAVSEVNAKFASMGIDETVVPVEASCPNPDPGALFSDPMFAQPGSTTATTMTFRPGRKWLSPGFTGVLAAEQLADGKVALAVEAVKPPVPACFPDTVYRTSGGGTTTNGVPIINVTPVTETDNDLTSTPSAGDTGASNIATRNTGS